MITLPFNQEFRQIRAATFVDTLLERLKLSSLWVGSDFAMGYQREGNVAFLRAQGEAKGFSLHMIDLIVAETDGAISSTSIREALLAGEVEKARTGWGGRMR